MTTNSRNLLWLCIAGLSCIAIIYGVARYWFRLETGPKLEVVESIRWERVEAMGSAHANVEFQNTGSELLIIDSISSGCDCTELQTTMNGQVTKIKEMRIPLGRSQIAQVKFEARGSAGSSMSQVIAYRTNEAVPENRERRLVLDIGFVGGGLTGLPTQIDFGTLRPGEFSEREFEIVDDSTVNRHIKGVASSHEAFMITKVEHKRIAAVGGGHSVVRGKLRFSSEIAGTHFGKIVFAPSESDSRPDPILLNAKVLPNLSIAPTICVLDDSEAQRTTLYHFKVESNVGEISEIEAVDLPAYLDCKIDTSSLSSERVSLTIGINSRLSES